MSDNYTQRRIIEANIFEQSIDGLKSQIGSIAAARGHRAWPVVFGSIEYSQRQMQKDYGQVKFPYLAIMIQSVNPPEMMYNKQAIFNGVPFIGAVSEDGNLRVEFQGLHVNVDFRVQVITQDLRDIIGIIKRWPFRQREIQFILENQNMEFPIRVTLAPSLVVPDQQFTETTGNLFIFETSCSMQTYVGEFHYIPIIKSVQLETKAVQVILPE